MLLNIEQTARDTGMLDSEMATKIDVLKARINKSEIADEMKLLEGKTLDNKEKDNNENHN
jgi:hypothetical protein